MHAKLIETYDNDPEAFRMAYAFVEAGDWVVWALCGKMLPLSEHFYRSSQQASYKSCVINEKQMVNEAILKKIRPNLNEFDLKKLHQQNPFRFARPGTAVGMLQGTSIPISAASIDAHACAFGLGAYKKGRFVAVVGTSGCFMLSSSAIKKTNRRDWWVYP